MAVSITNVRVFNKVAAAVKIQSAKTSFESSFATTDTLWAHEVRFQEGVVKSEFQGTHGSIFERASGRIALHTLPVISVRFHATPTIVSMMLDAFAGGGYTAGVLQWTQSLAKYVSFAFHDAPDGVGNIGQVWRFGDGWIRKLVFSSSEQGILEVEAEIWAEENTRQNIPGNTISINGVPSIFTSFTHRGLTLMRDPSGENVSLACRSFILSLEHAGEQFLGNQNFPRLIKEGFTKCRVQIAGRYSDEYKAIREDALANTFKRFTASYLSGAGDTLLFDCRNLVYDNPEIEVSGQKFADIDLNGWAMSADGSEPVVITKTGF